MSESSQKIHALELLRQMLGVEKDFRQGQWEAVEAVAVQKRRALVVQRTGWGKSLVYFLATKLLRESGAGPTLLISPLLSLMRNQIDMADRIGIRANTINSDNQQEWSFVERALYENLCDLILVSPERLTNERFLNRVLPSISGRIGLFVVDEAHCISDWGHDFRPDYRKITQIIKALPDGVPVLGTTATANNRVVADVQSQLGPRLTVLRSPLARESLRLQNIQLRTQSERLAWLVENLPKFEGSGIVYCLTVADTERVADWLIQNNFSARAYHAGNDRGIHREELEQAFITNKVKILVATVALGMGFDKPDTSFVIHFQRPGSVVAYYQQVGRAGRGLDKSYGILLSGDEDDEVHNYFIDSAFPTPVVFDMIIQALSRYKEMTIYEILAQVNASKTTVEKALKLLEIDGGIGQTGGENGRQYFLTPNQWQPDVDRYERVRALRRMELAQIKGYVAHKGCLMEFLQRALDDPHPVKCGRCANCRGKGLPVEVSPALVAKAESFLKGTFIEIQPRKQWPVGLFPGKKRTIPRELRNSPGRSLCSYGDAGWGELVRIGKYQQDRFPEALVAAAVHMIKDIWQPQPPLVWVTAIPSQRRPNLVPDFARRLASALGLKYRPMFHRIGNPPEQKTMQNSSMQAKNVLGTLALDKGVPRGPVLLVDDIIDSGWTLAIAGYLLLQNGNGPVYPFTLAQASGKD